MTPIVEFFYNNAIYIVFGFVFLFLLLKFRNFYSFSEHSVFSEFRIENAPKELSFGYLDLSEKQRMVIMKVTVPEEKKLMIPSDIKKNWKVTSGVSEEMIIGSMAPWLSKAIDYVRKREAGKDISWRIAINEAGFYPTDHGNIITFSALESLKDRKSMKLGHLLKVSILFVMTGILSAIVLWAFSEMNFSFSFGESWSPKLRDDAF